MSIFSASAGELLNGHISLNFNDNRCHKGNLIEKINCHLHLLKKLIEKLHNFSRLLKRDAKNFDENKTCYREEIEKMSGQINQKFTFFHENIMKVIDKNAPIKKLVTEERKGYLCHKTITSQTVSSEVQVKNFFFLEKLFSTL